MELREQLAALAKENAALRQENSKLRSTDSNDAAAAASNEDYDVEKGLGTNEDANGADSAGGKQQSKKKEGKSAEDWHEEHKESFK